MKKNPSARKTAAALAASGLLSLAAAPAASAATSSNPCSTGTSMQRSGACGAKTATSMSSMYKKKKNPGAVNNPAAAKMKNPCPAKSPCSAS